ncbi:MAG TPA: EAL domain-containing protein, partial [Ruminiclostridium sp.]|nr:EAL domain-containing protein [Ruminiclostridium sp.]
MFCIISFSIIKSKFSAQSALEKSELRIKNMAFYDALTDLPNRNLLNSFLKEALNNTDNVINKLGVMFIDLDNFKNVNDVFGHNLGDILLQHVSEKLITCVQSKGTVYRYGGDEFIVILENTDVENCSGLASEIIDEFGQPLQILNNEIYTSPSIGISIYPDHGYNADTLIKNADNAMYLAKKLGKNNYQFFNDGLSKSLSRKIELEIGLRKALLNNEFILYYQPLVDLKTTSIYGLEALIRWIHPNLGMISPAEFIPIAEESGLIVSIGEWVMKTAFTQNKLWQDTGVADVNISINVSGCQLKYSNICQTVRDRLAETGIPPQNVLIEITESVMQDSSHACQIVRELKSMGVKVAIDDFGTGYSSLSLLKNLDIDILKIDSSFIKDIDENPHTLEILKLIINMGHQLSFDIIIEGIETKSQAALLINNNCSLGQGYLFSKPLPADEIEVILIESDKIAV